MTTEATKLVDSFGRNRFRFAAVSDDNDIGSAMRNVDVDDSDRIMVPELTDREIAEEVLATLRVIADGLVQITSNPGALMSKMMPGMAGIMGAMEAGPAGGKRR